MVAYLRPLCASYFFYQYVEMRDKYVGMLDKYINMQHKYADIQEHFNQNRMMKISNIANM